MSSGRRATAAIGLWLVLGFLSCGDSPADDPGIPEWHGEFEIEQPTPPELLPCPEGWVDTPADVEGGVATCEPWPGGSPFDESAIALPVLTPCPDGWRELADPENGLATCEPWPEGGALDCAVDEAQFPGQSECTRVGTACPAGDWADDLPTDREITYVLAGAGPGGVGTRAAPFGTITEALEAVGTDATVALSKGTFDEIIEVRRRVVLWGACVAETIVASSVPHDSQATVWIRGLDTELRNLQLGGQRFALLGYGSASSVALQDVVINEAEVIAWDMESGARATGRNVVVRNTGSGSDGAWGRGLQMSGGASVELVNAVFENNREASVYLGQEGTSLGLDGFVIRNTLAPPAGPAHEAPGLRVIEGGTATVSRGIIEGSIKFGIVAMNPDTVIELSDVVVRDTTTVGTHDGAGAVSLDGATLNVDRTLFEGNQTVGLHITNEGSTASLVDTVVRDTLCRPFDGQWGNGLHLSAGAAATVERTAFDRNRFAAVYASDGAPTLMGQDVTIRGTLGQDELSEYDNLGGYGLMAWECGPIDLERVAIEGSHTAGVIAVGAEVELSDIVVRDTLPHGVDDDFGQGIIAAGGARVTIQGALLERNMGNGLLSQEAGTAVGVTNAIIRDTQTSAVDGSYGTGVEVSYGGHLELTNTLVQGNHYAGVFLVHEGSTAELVDVVVSDTGIHTAGGGYGMGVNVTDGSNLWADRLLVEENTSFGIWIHDTGSEATLSNLVVRDTQAAADVGRDHGYFGRGLEVTSGGRAEVSRALFVDNREVSVMVAQAGSEVVATDLIILNTLERTCYTDGVCTPAGGAGIGLGAYAEAHLEATRFYVTGSAQCGVQLAFASESDVGGEMDLHEGEVTGNPVGANIQTQDFDVSRLTDRVAFRDNGRNLVADAMPVPLAAPEP